MDLMIRSITARELALPLQWAAEEGWNPGLADAEPFHAADPAGFLMGFLADEPVACISVVRYDHHFGFLGLYIVRPDYRGCGYGMRLWQAGLDHLQGCVVGLDGVVAQQANYGRSGFEYAYTNVRYAGSAPSRRADRHPQVTFVGPELVSAISAYDRRFFPVERWRFLRAWLTPDHRRTFAFADECGLRGYGVLRTCREGFKMGPLFADTPGIAEAILMTALAQADDASVAIDIPEPNRAASALARRAGLSPVFETARMYKGPAPSITLDGIYGVTTLELG